MGTISVANDIFQGGLRGGSFLIDPISIGIAAIAITYFCGKNLKAISRIILLKYGIAWAIINHILDTSLNQFIGYSESPQTISDIGISTILTFFDLFRYRSTWMVFILIAITPLLTVKARQTPQQTF